MTISLVEILDKLKSDPTQVIQLYGELYNSNFFVLARPETVHELTLMEFVTYPSADGVRELPIFTTNKFILDFPSVQPIAVEIAGNLLWPRLREITEIAECVVAVNPGQSHGIRLTSSMILGMISKYESKTTE